MFPQDLFVVSQPSTAPSVPNLPLLAGLNPEQLAAVTLPPTHALILAGAGSGKTRVLTTRIAWLLQTGQVSPGGILAVTFTNKAAREMVTRLGTMLPLNVRGMWIGTFHGLCNRLLRAHHKLVNLPSTFQILDTQDQLSAIKRLCKQFNVDEERFPPKQLQWFIAGCKENGERPAAVQVRDEDTRKKVEIYQLYEDQCAREGVVDFGELMLRSFELLRDNDPVREHYQRRFRHILVDEFQDTNRLQYAWLKQLAGNEVEGAFQPAPTSVIAVGDDDQSIYAFRGARVGNMADFVREFGVQHQIKLERNYRSYSNILDSANALISHNSKRLGKNLRTDQGPGEPVRVFEASSDFEEAQWMVDEMRQLARGDGATEGFKRQEIAVLYRSNAQSRVIETALFNAGVPYRVYGGLRFFERAEIKHALAYLRLMENPHDDTSFLRVVNFPPRGIGARSIEQLQDAARAAGCSLHDAVSSISGKAGANLGAFVAKVQVLREQTQGITLREIIELVLDHSGLVEHYKADREGADRIENLEELASAAESFVTQEGFGKDAVALPLDEQQDAAPLTQSPASQGLDPALSMGDMASRVEIATPEITDAEIEGEIGASPLLAIVSVENKDKVPCDQPNCTHKHYVWKRVHVVDRGGVVQRLGSDCFEDEFPDKPLPRYETYEQLTNQQVLLLKGNPAEFAALIKREFFEATRKRKQAEAVNQRAVASAQARSYPKLGWIEQPMVDADTGETLSPLAAFLTHAALEAGDNQAQAGQDAVQLMTVHSSKGLEFDCVFITGMEEGLFPHENASTDRDGLEEERRLMYVAITRARQRLYLSHAQTRMLHGQTRYNMRSRFLDELPEEALKWITSKRSGFASIAPKSGAYGGHGISAGGQFAYKSERLASPPVPVQKTAPSHGLRSGMQVFHNKFGEGTVLSLEGVGDEARAQVNFPRHGVKWLALSVAKLTPV